MSDAIKIPITVDDKQAVAALKQTKEKVSQLGSSVSGMGVVLGSASTKMGGLVAEAGNLVGAFAAFGPAGLAIAGASAGIALLYNAAFKHANALAEANKAREKTEKDAWAAAKKGAEDAEKALRDYGKTTFQVKMAELKIRREEIKSNRKLLRDEQAQQEKRLRQIEDAIDRATGPGGRGGGALIAQRDAVKETLSSLQERIDLQNQAENNTYREFDALGKLAAVSAKTTKETKDRAAALRNAADKNKEFWRTEEEESAARDDEAKRRAKAFVDAANERAKAEKKAEQEITDFRSKLREKLAEEEERLLERRADFEKETIRSVADFGMSSARSAADFALSEIIDRSDIETRLAEAKRRGDVDRVSDLEEQRLQSEETVAARVIERLSAEAMGTGATLVAKGLGEAALGNPGGFVAAGIGAGLFAAGAAGTIGSAAALSSAGAAAETRAFKREQSRDTALRSPVGPGRAQGSGSTTVVNYYFGGPVFGNQDDAARAVARFNRRGERLEGGRP